MLIESEANAELAVLGAVIATAGECLDDVTIIGADFANPSHGDLFDLMRSMRNQSKHIDLVTMMDAAPEQKAFIATLTDHAPFAYAVESYANIVATHSMRRKLSAVAMGLNSLEPHLSLEDMSERARKLVDDAVGEHKAKVKFVRDYTPSVIERLVSKDLFVESPWKKLDYAIGGFRPGAVYVIAARPGVGKTVVAAQIAVALSQNGLVPFSSLEMSGDELVTRLISEQLQISVGHLKDARMTDRDWQLWEQGRAKVDALQIAIDDRSGIGPGEIRSFVRTVSRHGKLAGIVVDYMQLMTSKNKVERHNQVAEFSRQLKIMAKDFQVPVIALSQLNRNVENRAEAQPRLSDLRESGAIEQDADVVMLLRREGSDPHESLVIDVAKNRHGQTGEVELSWDGVYSRAVEWNTDYV